MVFSPCEVIVGGVVNCQLVIVVGVFLLVNWQLVIVGGVLLPVSQRLGVGVLLPVDWQLVGGDILLPVNRQ